MQKKLFLPSGKLRGIFKLFFIMKFALLILVVSSLQVYSKAFSQEKFNLSLESVKIKQALSAIEHASDYRFIYNDDVLPEEARVSISAKNMTLKQMLDELFVHTHLVYKVLKNNLVAIGTRDQAFTAIQVKGKVVDSASRQPLTGVTIRIKGTSIGTTSGANGEFTLEVPDDAVLEVSYLGYTSKEIPVNGRTNIQILLATTTTGLNQLVVIGYGTQKRKDVTGAISSIAGEKIKNLPVARFQQALAGKMSGVQVNTVNGRPGGGATIRIRGIGSIGAGNGPLVVVDGFPRSAFSLSPDQIESIDVLKSASATAIYGSRGANGVILITTKEPASQTQVQVNSSIGLQKVRRRGMVKVLNARQFAQFKKDRISDKIRFQENREPTPEDIPEMYRNPQQYGKGTNWTDEILSPALMTNQNFSVSGGGEKVKGMISATFLDQRGTVMGTGYKRYNLRTKVNASLGKVNIGLTIAPSLENSNYASTGGGRGGPYASSFLLNPIIPLRQPDDSLTPMIGGPGILGWPNPVLRIKEYFSTARNRTARTLVGAFAEYEIIKGLNFKSTFDIDWQNSRNKNFHPSTLGKAFNIPPPTVTTASYNTIQSINWQNNNTLHYNTNIGNHSIHLLAGFTVQKARAENGNFNATDFPDNVLHTLNVASTITGGTHATAWGLVSELARVNYAYKNKYLLTATIRRDGSSRFGSDNKWGTFPSVSVGWRVSDENFMKRFNKIDELKIRAGYGQTGNFNIGNYTHLGTVSSTYYVLNDQLAPGRSITNLGNTDLGWEEVNQLDIGLNLSMFRNRLNITADYYHKVTSDMLLSIEVPYTSGFSSSITNRGQITNNGIELAINTTVLHNPSWNWDINFNITHNSNKVTRLASPIFSPASTAQHITKEGYPPGLFYGYVVEGFFRDKDQIKNYPVKQPNAIPGSYIYKDINGDGRIDPIKDFAIIGNPYPDFIGGLTSSLTYKNFDFQVSMTGSFGNQILQTGREDFWNLDGVFNVSAMALHRWRSPDEPGDGKIPRAISHVTHRYNNSKWVEDGSNIWIRNVALGYTFMAGQRGFLQALGSNQLRIYFNVQNPWISNTNVQNPAVSLNPNDPLQPGETRNSNYPISKIFTLGVNVNF